MEKEFVDNKKKSKTAFMAEYKALILDTVISLSKDYCDKIEDIRDLIDTNIPKKLYRFRTFDDYSLDAFVMNKIYHSSPKKFNDPHDCLVYIDQKSIHKSLDSELNELADLKQLSNKLSSLDKMDNPITQELKKIIEGRTIENIHSQILDNIEVVRSQLHSIIESRTTTTYDFFRSHYKASCFTENIHSTLMWAHYANYHKGFALEYDFTSNKSRCLECKSRCEDFAFSDLYPVIYSKDRYDATDLITCLCLYDILTLLLGLAVYNVIPDRLAYVKANVCKGMDWKYEQEWRSILVSNSSRSDIAIKPTAIYIGVDTSPVHEDILIRYAREKSIDIYKMKVDLHTKEFKLSYDKIE